jgi:ABC-type nitrate/sulfonate/bicarbonate transport system substrate-binding protein
MSGRAARRPLRALVRCGGAVALLIVACAPATARPAAPAPDAPSAPPASAASGPSAAAPPAPAAAPRPLQPLKIVVPSKTVTISHLAVGQRAGIFEQHGFNAQVTVIASATAAIAALQAGEIDFYTASNSATKAALRGVPIRVVTVSLNRSDFQLLGAKGLTDVEQLRGKVVAGYGPETFVNTAIIEVLRRRGLEPGQYEILSAGDGPGRAAALVNGLAAATILDNSGALPLQKEGYPVLLRVGEHLELPQTGLAASIAALQGRRDFLREAMRAVIDALTVTRTQKERVVPIMADEFALSPEDAAQVYDILQPGWAADGRPTPAAMQLEFELDQRDLELAEPIRPDQVYDFSLLQELAGER